MRLYSWSADEPIDEAFFRGKIEAAIALRRQIGYEPRRGAGIPACQEVIAAEGMRHVRVEKFATLLVDYFRCVGGHAIIKGLRSPKDFEAEFQQGMMNHKLAPEIETFCLLTNLEQLFISSSLLKEVARLGGDVTDMLPAVVMKALQHKLRP